MACAAKMVALQLTLALVLVLLPVSQSFLTAPLRTLGQMSYRQAEANGCERLQEAGLAVYDTVIEYIPPDQLNPGNNAVSIDFTDREAVKDFLCDLAGVTSMGELASLFNQPEDAMRRHYSDVLRGMTMSMGLEPNEEGFREMLRSFDIIRDVLTLVEQIGFDPEPMFPEQEPDSSSSGEADDLDVDANEVYDFLEGMAERWGDDFGDVLARVFSMGTEHPGVGSTDRCQLTLAIVASSNEADFVKFSGLSQATVIRMFSAIHHLQAPLMPGAAVTMGEFYVTEVYRLLEALLDLGLLTLN